MNTIKFGKHSIKVKDSFAVEAGSGPRHLTSVKMGGMFIAGTYWRSDGLSYSKGKLRKVDQTTI
jgi:6-phosphogluconolactonase